MQQQVYVENVCKIGKGANCCKYLVCGSKGLECAKISPENKEVIDKVWGPDKVAQGDNCIGQDLILKKAF